MIEKELTNRVMKDLFTAIAKLRNIKEVKQFFRDIATFSELRAMSERWQVAQLIKQGIPYRAIAKKTGSSTATITRVAQWLHHGLGGYKLMLERMKI